MSRQPAAPALVCVYCTKTSKAWRGKRGEWLLARHHVRECMPLRLIEARRKQEAQAAG